MKSTKNGRAFQRLTDERNELLAKNSELNKQIQSCPFCGSSTKIHPTDITGCKEFEKRFHSNLVEEAPMADDRKMAQLFKESIAKDKHAGPKKSY